MKPDSSVRPSRSTTSASGRESRIERAPPRRCGLPRHQHVGLPAGFHGECPAADEGERGHDGTIERTPGRHRRCRHPGELGRLRSDLPISARRRVEPDAAHITRDLNRYRADALTGIDLARRPRRQTTADSVIWWSTKPGQETLRYGYERGTCEHATRALPRAIELAEADDALAGLEAVALGEHGVKDAEHVEHRLFLDGVHG
jgi:hypothetical protein